MNLPQLQTFLAILETGSLANASMRLHVAQSTVTARLHKLEEELGQSLFIRDKSGVSLTATGLKFRRYAEAMSDLWQQARQETSLPDGISSVCNLGCEPDLWPSHGSKLIGHLHEQFPDVAMSTTQGKRDELEEWLATGLIDVALCYQPVVHHDYSMIELKTESLVLVADRADAPMRNDPGYIFVDASDDFARRHSAEYSDAGIARVSFGSAVWALDFLLQRGGSAYLPEHLVEQSCTEGRLFRTKDAPVFSRKVFLIMNEDSLSDWPWKAHIEHWCDSV
ncbi:MAG: LysR family transcriptional regulator [Pseudomonadota bacterium]